MVSAHVTFSDQPSGSRPIVIEVLDGAIGPLNQVVATLSGAVLPPPPPPPPPPLARLVVPALPVPPSPPPHGGILA